MNAPEQWIQRREEFPPALRRLVATELRAGNVIVRIASTSPAPPFGAYVLLARPVRTRPRQSHGEIQYRFDPDANYPGQWFDLCRHYLVLEPAEAAAGAREIPGNSAARSGHSVSSPLPPAHPTPTPTAIPGGSADRVRAGAAPHPFDRVHAFKESMQLTYERWREGTSYAVELLPQMTPAEREQIERLLVESTMNDWRQVQALAALQTPAADAALRRAFTRDDPAVRAAVWRYAPHLIPDEARVPHLLAALRQADFFGGLTETVEQIRCFHPPAVIEAVYAAILERPGAIAAILARLLLEVHGKAKDLFDPVQRPFLLRFNTADPTQRRAAYDELRSQLAADWCENSPAN